MFNFGGGQAAGASTGSTFPEMGGGGADAGMGMGTESGGGAGGAFGSNLWERLMKNPEFQKRMKAMANYSKNNSDQLKINYPGQRYPAQVGGPVQGASGRIMGMAGNQADPYEVPGLGPGRY